MPPLIDATAPAPARPGTAELVPQYPWITSGGRQRFLPWWDPDQPVTPEIRRGLRKMLHDDAVKPALLTKLFSVSSLDWQFQAADPEDPRSRLVSDFCLYAARHMDGGTRALVEEVLFPGLIDGLSVCEVVLREEPEPFGRWAGKEMVRCLKAKEHAWPEEDRFGNTTGIYAQTELGFTTLPPERFVVFKYLPLFGRPHSDLQAAYRLYVARDTLLKLWLNGIERWGQPFMEGTYPAGDLVARDDLAARLGAVKGRTWVVHPDGTSVNFVDAAFSGAAAHEACFQKLTEGIYLSINGAFLQSLTSGTQHISQRGNSQTQKSTFELFVWHLAAVIADATNEKLWPLVTARNFAAAAPPQATLAGVNDNDLKQSADLDDVLLNKLSLPLSRKDRAAFYGRQLASTPDDALTPAKPAASPGPPLSPKGVGDAAAFSEGGRDFCGGPGSGVPGPCPQGGGGAAAPHTGRLADGREVRFVPHPKQRPDETMIMVDPKKWDKDWSKDSMHLPPEGQRGASEVPGRREEFKKFLGSGKPVEASRGGLDPSGDPYFEDGRHRFAVLRDLGADKVGVTVPKSQAAKITARYGAAAAFADPPADDPGPLLTVREAAQRLRLSPGTVRRLCEAGDLEHRRPAGRYRVTERGLSAYLAGTVSPPG